MKHLLWVAGLVALAPAIYFLIKYSGANNVDEGKKDLMIAGAFLIVSLVFFAIHFFKKFRAEGDEEISITKF